MFNNSFGENEKKNFKNDYLDVLKKKLKVLEYK